MPPGLLPTYLPNFYERARPRIFFFAQARRAVTPLGSYFVLSVNTLDHDSVFSIPPCTRESFLVLLALRLAQPTPLQGLVVWQLREGLLPRRPSDVLTTPLLRGMLLVAAEGGA